jgi:Family of unknown function (DUF6176)
MIHLNFTPVHPDKVEELRAWFAEIEARADEARETLEREGVRHEQAYLLETGDGPVLVYAVECEDYEAAGEAFRASTAPIDVQHREIMPQLIGKALEVTPVLDIRL